jgi:hypothetical protein
LEEVAAKTYWFRAKRYGWGWGWPLTWQGWLVLAAFVGLFALGFLMFPPDRELAHLLIYLAVLTVLLVAICWARGEPPRWRWGGGDDA